MIWRFMTLSYWILHLLVQKSVIYATFRRRKVACLPLLGTKKWQVIDP